MNSNHSNLKDPLEELPLELFSHSLAFLPPKFVASSSATSRSWRSAVNTNPVLHREIDLLNLGEGKMVPILYHANRISALSFDRLVKVSLNLTSFWQEYLAMKESSPLALESSISNLDVLMLTLSRSKASLKEIFLFIAGAHRIDPLPFVVLLIKNLESFDSIRLMEVGAPIGLGLEASQATPGHKRFILYKDEGSGLNGLADGGELMKLVKNFVKGEFISFDMIQDDWSHPLPIVRIMEELESSGSTLQHLDLSNLDSQDDPLPLWSFALRCQNLVSLRLFLKHFGGPRLILEVPQNTVRAANLKILSLNTIGLKIDWDSYFLNWIGSGGLEEIHLEIGRTESDEDHPVSNEIPESIFLSSIETLRSLSAQSIAIEVNFARDYRYDDYWIAFPNLQHLDLSFLDESAWGFFERLKCPKLQELTLRLQHNSTSGLPESISESITGMGCLVFLLRNHASTLIALKLGVAGTVTWEDLASYSEHTFDFKSLRQIGFFSYSRHREDGNVFNEWLSESHFPALADLDCSKESKHLFNKNAPLLQLR